MDNIIQGVSAFEGQIFPGQRPMSQRPVRGGQSPKVRLIACADSRGSPAWIPGSAGAAPG